MKKCISGIENNIKRNSFGLLYALPGLVGVLFFYWIPFIKTIKDIFWVADYQFNGFNEFKNLFASEAFALSMKNMMKFFVIFIPLLIVLSLLVALSMQYLSNRKSKIVSFLFLLHLLPMVIPSIIIAAVLQIFLETYGVINGILAQQGRDTINFLYSTYDMLILGFIYLWKNYGYCMVILYGGINGVPEETIESAKIEGAGGIRVLLSIILPQVRNFILFTISIGVIGIFKIFKESYMLFGKYPHDSVYMIQNFMNNNLYSMNYGRLSAASLILIIIFSLFIYFLFIRSSRQYEKR